MIVGLIVNFYNEAAELVYWQGLNKNKIDRQAKFNDEIQCQAGRQPGKQVYTA